MLTHNTQNCFAIVTYVEREKRRATLIYGNKKRMVAKLSELHVKVKEGSLLKLYWLPAPNEVQKYNLSEGETVSVIAAYCYNKKKDVWSWTCVLLQKK